VSDTQVEKALTRNSKTLKKAANAGSPAMGAVALSNQGYLTASEDWTTQAVQCAWTRTGQ
jgi:hypothetical protein